MDEERFKIIQFARKRLKTCENRLEKDLTDTKEALQFLTRKGKEEEERLIYGIAYSVSLSPKEECEGVKKFSEAYQGHLEWAIKSAEKEFELINENIAVSVQAKYSVGLKIGKTIIPLPKKYWERYTKEKSKRLQVNL